MDIQRFLDQPIPPLGTFDSDYDCGEAMECGEAVVDITEIHPRIKFDASYLKAGIPGALTRCYVRSGVYDRLCMALDMLPEEYSFLIYDTLRPLRVQKALFDDYYAHLEKQYPNADAKQLETLTREFVALPVLNITRPSSHQTGGAVDLTLMKNGQPVDMGTVFDEFEEIAHSDYFDYKTDKMKNFYFSANYDFKSQFATGYDYKTPGTLADADGNDLVGGALRQAWRDARVFKSGFLAPAYTNLALGIDCKPTKWLSINLAPLTGGFVIVKDAELREKYSMGLKKAYNEEHFDSLSDDAKAAFEAAKADKGVNPGAYGSYFRGARFEFGAQFKADAKVNVNDNFSYSTQVVVFVNYLDINHCPRINWDNRIDWKLAKYFSLTLSTNLIYDDQIKIFSDKDGLEKARVQFKESVAFGFTYTIASKK